MAAVVNLALVDPAANVHATAIAAILVAAAGATYDIVIDAYRIETLKPHQLGVGSGMTQYGWRIGSARRGVRWRSCVAARFGWHVAYLACALFALPAMLTGAGAGRAGAARGGPMHGAAWRNVGIPSSRPFCEFLRRTGAWLVLLFILLHKIGDTLANLTVRLLFNDLQFTNDEIAALRRRRRLLGLPHRHLHRRRALHAHGAEALGAAGAGADGCVEPQLRHCWLPRATATWGWPAAIGFENIASGFGGVVVVAYFSALCNLRFTATQYALISAGASVVGRAAHRHHGRRADRSDGLRELLPADHGGGAAGHPAVLVHDAHGPGGSVRWAMRAR